MQCSREGQIQAPEWSGSPCYGPGEGMCTFQDLIEIKTFYIEKCLLRFLSYISDVLRRVLVKNGRKIEISQLIFDLN